MATLVLGTVGRLVGGPIGGIIGTTLGAAVDRSLFAGGSYGGGRMANLAVQSAAYGEPIAVISGRIRTAGNVIWSSGIKESSGSGGKGQGSTYNYSASFAVGLAGREIASVGRIWADGKLIRDFDGEFTSPISMRLHRGKEDQAVDPLIAATEGAGGTPAYRGIAYAVFEDLPLAEYGNRIPNLTFEVVADDAEAHDLGRAMAALGRFEDRPILSVEGRFPPITGHFSATGGSIAEGLEPLLALAGASVSGSQTIIIQGEGGESQTLSGDDCHARLPFGIKTRERRRVLGGEGRISAVEIAFYDTTRDFQPGLQRARRGNAGRIERLSIAGAMTPSDAKALAVNILARTEAARSRTIIRLPWRHLGIRPGSHIRLADEAGVWRVREVRFESFIVHLDLERTLDLASVDPQSDGGRAAVFADGPAGETVLQILELPSLPWESNANPRLWVAAAGRLPGWRRSVVEISADDGASYASCGVVTGPAVMGHAVHALSTGPTDSWDRWATLEVELLADAMWLESRSGASVLNGANLALLGDEIIQFCDVEAVAPKRFRLTGLLRGRLGTEAAIGAHTVGDRFVLLDRTALLPVDLPVEAVGRVYRMRAAGVGDNAVEPLAVCVTGVALKPLAPAHLRLSANDGDITGRWIRRSRLASGWPDFVDSPLGEAAEAYRIDVSVDGKPVRSSVVEAAEFRYSAADLAEDGGGTLIAFSVAQISGWVGPGATASAELQL